MHLKYGISAVLSILIWTTSAMAWGQNGHRIVGRIAENHLTPEARQAVAELIGPESLAQVSTWADEIKSDRARRHANPWHYINVEAGETFENAAKNPNGDIIESLARFEQVLRDSGSSRQAKAEALKFIVHFVGDIHQPLHAGYGKDRGGNDIKVRWFGGPSNLHAVWDTELIEYESMGQHGLVGRTAARTAGLEQRRMEPTAMLVRAFEIERCRPLEVGPGFEHEAVG